MTIPRPAQARASLLSADRRATPAPGRDGAADPRRARMGATIGGGEFTCAAGASQLRNFLAIIG
jgi:hypothetical protein